LNYTEKSEKETEFLCQMAQQWQFLHAPATSVSQINFSAAGLFQLDAVAGQNHPFKRKFLEFFY